MLIFVLQCLFISVYCEEVLIYTFNDFHGQVFPHNLSPGAARFSTTLKQEYLKDQATGQNSILITAGDLYQGNYLSTITKGDIVSTIMKYLNVTISAIGNHELDWGQNHFSKWESDGGFEFISSNIIKMIDNTYFIRPFSIKSINDIRIAFLGLTTTETPQTTSAGGTQGLHFQNVTQSAQYWCEHIKKHHAPDLIIAVAHIGSYQEDQSITGPELNDLAQLEDIDAIITGHSEELVFGYMGKIPVIQALNYGRYIGKLRITKQDEKFTIRPEIIKVDLDCEEDPEIHRLLNQYQNDHCNVMNEIIGQALTDLDSPDELYEQSQLGAYFTQRLYQRYQNQLDLVLLNGGLLRKSLKAGPITLKDIFEIIPFDNTFIIVIVNGQDLISAIKHGIGYQKRKDGQFYNLYVEMERINQSIQINNISFKNQTSINPHEKYRIGISSFQYSEGDGYDFSRALNVSDTGASLRDLLIQIITQDKTIEHLNIDYFSIKQKTVKLNSYENL